MESKVRQPKRYGKPLGKPQGKPWGKPWVNHRFESKAQFKRQIQ